MNKTDHPVKKTLIFVQNPSNFPHFSWHLVVQPNSHIYHAPLKERCITTYNMQITFSSHIILIHIEIPS